MNLDFFRARLVLNDDGTGIPTICEGFVDPELRRFYTPEAGAGCFFDITDDDVILRCAGLRDSKGTLIYEGDKVSHGPAHIKGRVVFDNEWNRFEVEYALFPSFSPKTFPLTTSGLSHLTVLPPEGKE